MNLDETYHQNCDDDDDEQRPLQLQLPLTIAPCDPCTGFHSRAVHPALLVLAPRLAVEENVGCLGADVEAVAPAVDLVVCGDENPCLMTALREKNHAKVKLVGALHHAHTLFNSILRQSVHT